MMRWCVVASGIVRPLQVHLPWEPVSDNAASGIGVAQVESESHITHSSGIVRLAAEVVMAALCAQHGTTYLKLGRCRYLGVATVVS